MSVTLNSISVLLAPFHNSQVGVISDESHFKLGLSVITKLRNDSEKDFPNVVVSFKEFSLQKETINEIMQKVMTVEKDSRLWKIKINLEAMCARRHGEFTLPVKGNR